MPARIEDGVSRPAAVEIEVDGDPLAAFPGESIAAALIASGRRMREIRVGVARNDYSEERSENYPALGQIVPDIGCEVLKSRVISPVVHRQLVRRRAVILSSDKRDRDSHG